MKKSGIVILTIGFFLFAQVAQAQWTPAKRLTWSSDWSTQPAIAVDSSSNLHLVWLKGNEGNCEIYYKKSVDGGTTWTASKRLTWTDKKCGSVAMAVDYSGNIHLVWYGWKSWFTEGNCEIYYRKSTDGGTTWTPARRLTCDSGYSAAPEIAVDASGNLHVVWYNDTPGWDFEVYYKKSTDGGVTWSAGKRLTWTNFSQAPVIAVDSSANPHVWWEQDQLTYSNTEIVYRKSTDQGLSWIPAKRLTWTFGWSGEPSCSVDSSDNLLVVWGDNTPGNGEVYFKRSTNGGTSWTASLRMTWTSDFSFSPSLAADSSGNVHVVWGDSMPLEIYYKKSMDGGSTWMMSQRLTWNSGDSGSPSIAADPSDNLHLVWCDDTPGNYEIYYKKYVKE